MINGRMSPKLRSSCRLKFEICGRKVAETENDFKKALDSVARWLAIRDHSIYELKTKLARRFESDVAVQALLEAEARGWLASDEVIAERLAASLDRRGKSKGYISAQLKKRRLPAVSADPESEIEKARACLVRKFGEEKLTFEQKAKAFRFLKYRGFDDRSIRKALE